MKTTERIPRVSTVTTLRNLIPLTIVCAALVAFGCGGAKNRVQKPPEAPQYASIRAACLEHKKSKDNGELQVPIEREAQALGMLVDCWQSAEYAKKELAKAAVTIQEIRDTSEVDYQVSETRRLDAEARAEKHRRHFWYAVGAGVVAAVLGIIVGGLAF